jgi:hypothetical protein
LLQLLLARSMAGWESIADVGGQDPVQDGAEATRCCCAAAERWPKPTASWQPRSRRLSNTLKLNNVCYITTCAHKSVSRLRVQSANNHARTMQLHLLDKYSPKVPVLIWVIMTASLEADRLVETREGGERQSTQAEIATQQRLRRI